MTDPRIKRAMEKRAAAAEAFDRAYGKMRRALAAMEKARRVMRSADRTIDRVMGEQAAASPVPGEKDLARLGQIFGIEMCTGDSEGGPHVV